MELIKLEGWGLENKTFYIYEFTKEQKRRCFDICKKEMLLSINIKKYYFKNLIDFRNFDEFLDTNNKVEYKKEIEKKWKNIKYITFL